MVVCGVDSIGPAVFGLDFLLNRSVMAFHGYLFKVSELAAYSASILRGCWMRLEGHTKCMILYAG